MVLINDLEFEGVLIQVIIQPLHIELEWHRLVYFRCLQTPHDKIGNIQLQLGKRFLNKVIGSEHPDLVDIVLVGNVITETFVQLGLVIIRIIIFQQDLGFCSIDIRHLISIQIGKDTGKSNKSGDDVPVFKEHPEE